MLTHKPAIREVQPVEMNVIRSDPNPKEPAEATASLLSSLHKTAHKTTTNTETRMKMGTKEKDAPTQNKKRNHASVK